jgi:outer membrane protein
MVDMSHLRKSRWLFALSVPFWLSIAAFGQAKIGIVDVQTALSQTAEVKKALAELDAKYKPRQEQGVKLQKELAAINQQLSLGNKLTEQAQSDLNVQVTRKQRELTRIQEDLQADVTRDQSDIVTRCTDRMEQIAIKLSEEKGLDAIFASGATVYFKPVLDLTKDLVAAYDKAYPVK